MPFLEVIPIKGIGISQGKGRMVYENSLSLSLSPVQSVSGAALIHDHEKAMEGGGNIYLVCESASVFLPFVVVRAI